MKSKMLRVRMNAEDLKTVNSLARMLRDNTSVAVREAIYFYEGHLARTSKRQREANAKYRPYRVVRRKKAA